ncbi:MAG: acyl-CoA dehydrogenase family protein [Planctomycetota bacterium]
MTGPPAWIDRLERVAAVAAANATAVDGNATFPQATIDAMRSEGLLGLISAKIVGGLGEGLRAAAMVVERLARECGSSAMVVHMHLAGAALIEECGSEAMRREVASGEHLSTLAFSEASSRSQFWAPTGTATAAGEMIQLDAKKSWVTSASHCTAYVWSSKPVSVEGASTLWLVPRDTPGLSVPGAFTGLGLRGNDSTPVAATAVRIPAANRLGDDGAGFGLMMEVVLPFFNVMNAACSIGLMEAITSRTAVYAAAKKFEHTGERIADLPQMRAKIAAMRIRTDCIRALLLDTLEALETGRPDAMLRVLEIKCAAGDAATEVAATGMRVCGGSAYRKDVGVERYFRDAQAASVMAPTSDQLLDFIGKAVCGLPLF